MTGDLSGLDAGVYHFNPADVSLGLLRRGDFRRNLAQATATEPAVAAHPQRLSVREHTGETPGDQARTYRHFGWDNGTLLANMLAVSAALGLPAEIVLGFVDGELNRLIDPRYPARGFLVPCTDRAQIGEFAASPERGSGVGCAATPLS